jgi:hypothetical protein
MNKDSLVKVDGKVSTYRELDAPVVVEAVKEVVKEVVKEESKKLKKVVKKTSK